jgi:hypothetical protein
VIAALGWRVHQESGRLAAYELTLGAAGLAACGVSYVLGLMACAVFWRQAMRDLGGLPTWASTLAAYFAGHLGKYVPGKGLVLVIRSTMVRGPGLGVVTSAVTAAQETLLMMATGALLAGVFLIVIEAPHRAYLLTLAGVLAIALGAVSLPATISRLGWLAARPFRSTHDIRGLAWRWSTWIGGAVWIAGGWMLMGASLAGALAAMDQLDVVLQQRGLLGTWALLTTLVALATVGGFVSLTPGGLGFREWVLVETLGPVIGGDHAIVAAVVLRLVWIVAEVVAAGAFWIADQAWNRRRTLTN